MPRLLHDPPGVAPSVDVPAPGQRLVADAQGHARQRGRPSPPDRPRRVRRRRSSAAGSVLQTSISGAPSAGITSNLRSARSRLRARAVGLNRLEIAERLAERDRKAEVAGDAADVGGAPSNVIRSASKISTASNPARAAASSLSGRVPERVTVAIERGRRAGAGGMGFLRAKHGGAMLGRAGHGCQGRIGGYGAAVSVSSRRPFVLPVVAADAALLTFKLANNVPLTHPMSARRLEAIGRIKEATGGQVQITLFPSSQLGSDTDTWLCCKRWCGRGWVTTSRHRPSSLPACSRSPPDSTRPPDSRGQLRRLQQNRLSLSCPIRRRATITSAQSRQRSNQIAPRWLKRSAHRPCYVV